MEFNIGDRVIVLHKKYFVHNMMSNKSFFASPGTVGIIIGIMYDFCIVEIDEVNQKGNWRALMNTEDVCLV